MNDTPALTFDDVVVRYPGRTIRALDGVSLTAHTGRLTAVVGPNGSGKSTLVRALLRLVPLERGGIRVDSAPLASVPPRHLPDRWQSCRSAKSRRCPCT
ncbi:MAG: ATP-binding cassette domain-containing protein [Gemmatimonadaceae bacterium]|nr:ATP-binding cassette domain-containing protein [Gemmatimonadaceae bacterium]